MKTILCAPIFFGTKSQSQHHLALQQGRNSCIFRHFYKPNQNFSTNTNLAHFSNCQNNLQSSHHLSFQTLQRIFHILHYKIRQTQIASNTHSLEKLFWVNKKHNLHNATSHLQYSSAYFFEQTVANPTFQTFLHQKESNRILHQNPTTSIFDIRLANL